VSQLFKAWQGKDEKMADWIHKIQILGTQFREAALLNCSEGAREGTLGLSDRLRNICFIQGLVSDRIQTIVRNRNYQNFDKIAETAVVEESAIASKQEIPGRRSVRVCVVTAENRVPRVTSVTRETKGKLD
jgi:hypothetical protein